MYEAQQHPEQSIAGILETAEWQVLLSFNKKRLLRIFGERDRPLPRSQPLVERLIVCRSGVGI
ncbi:hypothetical protein [Trichocoleus sp. FACHB-262]|uniref:hypothetical protein n=1 Tax=Trichocoleus sp. FACHB-262 TaxID=2692869 RepID=UPI00168A1C4F|nr:hypothetical protein [Trichocoleus sp. FACHB-262]MBD2121889.1 hypothetical protein [Trichocoleus sp. FACHB-262]